MTISELKNKINNECYSNFHECSLDDEDKNNKQYMTDINDKVIDFDHYKRIFCNDYLKTSEDALKSVDCYLLLSNNDIYLIEFKNGDISKKIRENLKIKIKDSILILTESLDKNINYLKNKVTYIVVYNESKNKSLNEDFKRMVSVKSKEGPIKKFKLDCMYGMVKALYTITENEFEHFWNKQLKGKQRIF